MLCIMSVRVCLVQCFVRQPEPRPVNWYDAKHHDLTGRIKSVEEKYKGNVELEDGQVYAHVCMYVYVHVYTFA